jgi:osmotically-inducible protein OsmY
MSDTTPSTGLAEQFEAILRQRLKGRVRELRVVIQNGNVILRGSTSTYYAKQLAQHLAMEAIKLPILANEIEVGRISEEEHYWQPGEPV